MKILLIGAGGVASVLSKFLAKTNSVSEIVCGTVNLTQAKEFISPHSKIKFITLDASREEDVEKAAGNVDLIINASLPDFNEIIMQASLKVGANYLDLCSFLKDGKTAEQLKFDHAFKESKLKAIIGAGVSPGISNLLVADAADKMNEVDEVKIRTIEEQKASELIFSWSPKVTLDELTAEPLVLENGEYRSIKPFDEPELFDFPQPYSKKRVMSISCDELATIPHYVKIKNMTYKATGTDIDFGNALSRLGLFNNKPVLVDGKQVIPVNLFKEIAPSVPSPKEMIRLVKDGVIEEAYFACLVEVIGEEDGKKIKIRNFAKFPDIKKVCEIFPGATYISYPTGLAAYTFVMALNSLNKYGVFPPEALDKHTRKELLLELENKGIIFEEAFSNV